MPKYVVAYHRDSKKIGTEVEMDATEAKEAVRTGRLRPVDDSKPQQKKSAPVTGSSGSSASS